jgi:hypothetical protein
MTSKHLLTKEQETFVKKHKISQDLLINANGEGMSDELLQQMHDEGKVFAYNVNDCPENAEHSIRTISGDCPQCDTTKVTAALREHKNGYIYIAGSKKGAMIKVGSANETKARTPTFDISSSKYGGYDDWEVLFHARTVTMGRIERQFQEKLSEYKTSYQFEKAGKLQNGGELYRCSYAKAKEVILDEENQLPSDFTLISEKKHLIAEYNFKNLKVRVATPTSDVTA